jgi:hypothetical protein
MHARRPTETTHETTMARRGLIAGAALALVLAMGLAGAGSALAGSGRHLDAVQRGAAGAGHPMAHEGPTSTAGSASPKGGPASREGGPAPARSSPVVPLVLAGIVILAAAGPWVPPRSRYVFYRIERRW